MQTTIETIVDGACGPDVRQPTDNPVGGIYLKMKRENLLRAWKVLNKWAVEKLVRKAAIDVPNFARVGWQRFRRIDGLVSGYVMTATCDPCQSRQGRRCLAMTSPSRFLQVGITLPRNMLASQRREENRV